MRHSFIDQYSGLDSFVHRLDPRTKLIASLAVILAILLTPSGSWKVFAAYLLILLGLVWLARLPFRYVLKRSLIIFPFVLMIAIFIPFFKEGNEIWSWDVWAWHIGLTYEGLTALVNVMIKAWLSILCLIVLTSSSKFADLLQGMYRLKVPLIFVQIISFMYRYIFVLTDQAMRMQMARDSRNFGGNRRIIFKTMGSMIGMLFIRSYERGERIYAAMLSRGYTGELPAKSTLRLKLPDACFAGMLLILLVCPAILWW